MSTLSPLSLTSPPAGVPSRPAPGGDTAHADRVLSTTAAHWGLVWPVSAPSQAPCSRPLQPTLAARLASGRLLASGPVRVRRRLNQARRAQARACQPVAAWSLSGLAW
ncbi:hypothetical protein PSQ40_06270 [Curvibacter sp. HBC61]|uniref:Uncharacterized protein n=1 Tax=Curvibacter cyanobacteriorum TaxID=3026422 RepID=A0ABT5MVT9_9BURK|nr:hypothetical protein [Curvibacter sp. HBC61]MDD0838169.1 hypothetical protein [Curvibacter sp. HBC61]